MTGPRHTASSITDDQLDALYERAEQAERDHHNALVEAAMLRRQVDVLTHVARGNRRHVQAIVPELDKACDAVERARAELARLNGETRGLNPYALAGRRDAVARIRAALDPQE
ncbi:MAG: hypothetical protein LBV60_01590 [Streptomyces sp.]|jgi:hypothetical protein|nr:hypothetical protein [Streptomyces sp.]